MSVGVGRSFAGDGPGKPLSQEPPAIEAEPEVIAASPAPDMEQGSVVAEDGDCDDFCGMPICSPPGRFWLRGDYLMWWTNGQRLPPLVTTSPQGTPRQQAGVLPDATILYGNDTVNNDGRSGFRSTLGVWLGPCHMWGVEFDYFNLGERDNSFARSSTGDPILARPFFNVQTNQLASELVAYPGVAEGTISADAKDYFHSAGVTLTYNVCAGDSCCDSYCEDPCDDVCLPPTLFCCRTDLLVGFRYYNLSDQVGIHETLRDVDPQSPIINTVFDIRDNFDARNDFYGTELGLRTKIYRGRWSLDLLGKIAVGNNHQTITIDGQTVITAPDQPTQTFDTGLMAGPSNSGTFQRDVFTMIPQLGIELGYQVSCHWRAFAGYNILYWGNVSRAGDQIDLNLDPRNFPPTSPTNPGLPFPAFAGRTDSFWAQGVNVGAEYRF